jgi:hypothetical protein
MPGVSKKIIWYAPVVLTPAIRFLVVWGFEETTATFCPT